MRKLKLSLIANERSRKTTFMKRKKGLVKKIHELTTLCGVQACAVIYSPYQSVPESWPSKEGVKEVTSRFMEMPMTTRTKTMLDQETYLRERIAKGQQKLNNLIRENRELHIRQFMFDCIKGKMSEYRYDARDLHDLQCYIQNYIDLLTQRMKIFTEIGEPSSFPPFVGVVDVADPPVVTDVPSYVAADATVLSEPSGFYDHIQYQNMNMNQNQHEPIQHHAPINFCDFFQNQKMHMSHNQQEPVQYQAPTGFQNGIYNMNLNPNLNSDSNHNLNLNLNLNSNQYLEKQESFMDRMLEQHKSYAGGHISIPLLDGSHYKYHQLPTANLATTSDMPSTTTTNNVYAPYINNNL